MTIYNDKNKNEKCHLDLILIRITQVRDVLTEVSELAVSPHLGQVFNGLISEEKNAKPCI